MLNFADWPIWLNLLIFAGAAAFVWMSGTRLSKYVDVIATRTGIGHAFAGLVLLGGITSLPEVAVSTTASLTGESVLALNNILGSVAAQVALLALADALIGREALTSVVVEPIVLLQAALNILLLAMVAGAVTAGDLPLLWGGVWSWSLMVGYLLSMWFLSRYRGRTPWMAHPAEEEGGDQTGTDGEGEDDSDRSTTRLILGIVGLAAVILFAGYLLSETGSAVAAQSGLGSAFFGATFVAVATSLPEISTMVAAVRLRRYEMALGDIFGTNLFNAALVFSIDILSPGGPVLDRVGAFSAFGALLGLVLTTIFMVGVVERRDRTVLRMGWDSLAALVFYIAGLGILWTLRGQAGES
ncbi:MAG: sodium:calcium antiporter [Gammaproteobacteria bacterium]